MSDVKTIRRSFAGGEITPELFGRLDLTKHQTGLARCRNFRVLPHGPVVNREGTQFIIETKNSATRSRLIRVVLSGQASYILEFGELYVRFHTNGGTVLEAVKNITGVTQANPGVLTSNAHGFSNGQWVFITAVAGMTQLNRRYYIVANATANTFTLTDTAGTAINTSGFGAYTSGGTAARVYEIASPYTAADLPRLRYAQANATLTLTHPLYAPRELVYTSPTSWAFSTTSFDTPRAAPTNVAATATVNAGAGGTSVKYSYLVTSTDDDGNESVGAISAALVQNNLYTAGNRNRVQWTGAAGATGYNIYRSQIDSLYGGGFISSAPGWGFIGTAQIEFIDDNIEPDYTRTAPVNQTVFNAAGEWPAAVAYFEQRRVFAGTTNDPQTTWLTRIGSDFNMAKSTPIRDDDAFSFRIASLEAQQIRHIVPLEDLLYLTDTHVWRMFSTTDAALTVATVKPRPTAAIGASDVTPVNTSNAVLFEENGTGHLIELRYSWEQNGYADNDASLLAPHLFDGYSLNDIAFSPRLKTVWATRSDGVLLGMTYVPKQEVLAWHWHDTDGLFESVASAKEGTEDGNYFIAQRTINGRTVRYIERLKSRAATLINSFVVDAGATYSGAATTTITNLHHLEGETVSVLADGIVHAQKVVANGAITLEAAASVVHVGLPIIAQAQLLPLDYETAGLGLGEEKNLSKAYLRVLSSSGIKAGPTFDKLREYRQRTTEPYGSPPALKTGVITITLDPQWDNEGQLCVQQDQPLPITLLSIVLEAAVSG